MNILWPVLLILSLLSQGATSGSLPRQQSSDRRPHVIENVSAVFSVSAPVRVVLRVTGYQPDACDYPVDVRQQRTSETVDIDIFRLVPSGVRCAATVIPYAQTIPLDGTFEPGVYEIRVNDEVLEIAIPDRYGQSDGSGYPVRLEAIIDDVEVSTFFSYPAQVELHVTGWLVDGCESSVEIEQARFQQTISVTITQWVDPMVRCEDTSRRLDEWIRLEDELMPGRYTVNVNDYRLMLDIPPVVEPPPLTREYGVVESVDVRILDSYPYQVVLDVRGYFASGCDYLIRVDYWSTSDTARVEIYREVPFDILCPAMVIPFHETVRLDGGFEAGTVTITVNDYVLHVRL